MSRAEVPKPGPPDFPTADQQRLFWTTLVAVSVVVLISIAALAFTVFVAFLIWSYPVLLPLGLAVLIALVLDPAVSFLVRRGLPRRPTSLAVCVLVVIGFILFWAFVLPTFYERIVAFLHVLPQEVSLAGDELLKQTSGMPEIHLWIQKDLPVVQQQIPRYLGSAASHLVAPVGSALGFILGFGFVPIYVYYFLADQDRFARSWREFVPFRPGLVRNEVIALVGEITQVLVSYLRGQVIVASVDGLLTFIGLSIIGVPQSMVLGVLTGALSLVPFLGIIASILPALVLAFVSANGDPQWQVLRPILVLVVFATVQLIESMVVVPRVQSQSTGLHPLVIILGILLWSLLLPGLLGPVVAVPLTCAAVVLLRRYVWQYGRRKRAAVVGA